MSKPSAPRVLDSSASLTIHLIPHTHWDREWYLTRAAFQARLVPVLDAALDQLERDPAARFVLDGQTVLLEDYLQVRPEAAPRIAALVQRGALEIGPWYVLSDLLIPSASSLRRNLHEGLADAGRFGGAARVLYSPDAFGHPAWLPELAAEFGIGWAVIRRGLGRPGGEDRDLYRWKGEAGASLVVLHLPAAGYDLATGLDATSPDLPRRWSAIRGELLTRAAGTQIALPLGADHHAMHADVAALRAAIQALETGHRVRVSSLSEYFAAVEASKPRLTTLRGELRRSEGHTWVLQGVHSSRSRMKRSHALAELQLSRGAAPLAALAKKPGGHDQEALLRLAWRTLLQCQFHDTLAGTTSDAVQQEQAVRLAAVESVAREVATRSLWRLAGYDPDRSRAHPGRATPVLAIWNPSRRTRAGIVSAELTWFRRDVLVGVPDGRTERRGPGFRPVVLRTPEGRSIPVQVVSRRRSFERLDAPAHYPDQDEVDRVRVAFEAPRLAGRQSLLLAAAPGRARPARRELNVRAGYLANHFLEAWLTRTGSLTLAERRSGSVYRGLCELSDEPDRGDLYSFSRGPGAEARGGRAVSQRILAAGPLLGAIETRWRPRCAGSGRLEARMVVSLAADAPLLRIHFELENQASDHRLRARFPVGVSGSAVVGGPEGYLRRAATTAIEATGGLEQEVTTAPAQRCVAVASGKRGLALFAPGCVEYEWASTGLLSLTLLRSVGELSRSNLPERPGHAAWPMATPLAQEPGRHTIELALAAVREPEINRPRLLEQLWEDAFLTLQTCFLRDYVNPAAPSPSSTPPDRHSAGSARRGPR